MRQTRTYLVASLLVLGTTAAGAQSSLGGAGLSAGTSGNSAGMISGGGTAATNLDAGTAFTSKRSDESLAVGAAANASADDDGRTRAKARKQRASSRAYDFTSPGPGPRVTRD